MRAPAAASLGDYATGINASGLVTVVSRVAYTWRRSLLTQLPTLPGGETHARSEEHTSELQSLTNLVCRLLLEKKNKQRIRWRISTKLDNLTIAASNVNK